MAGAACLAIGLGLGPHLAKDGLTPTSVAGLVAALVGMALLGLGVRRVWRTGRLVARLLVVPVAVLLVATLALTVAQGVAATVVPRAPLSGRTPASVGLRYEEVAAVTGDGVRLAGWYVPSANGAAVVLRHGSGSRGRTCSTMPPPSPGWATASSWSTLAAMVAARAEPWTSAGTATSTPARRWTCSSGGLTSTTVGSGSSGCRWVARRPSGPSAADDRIRAVAAEGATNRVAGDKVWLADEVGVRGWLQGQLDRLTYGTADLLTATSPPPTLRESAAAAAPRPVLLVASAQSFEEVGAARFIAARSPGSVSVWLAPGGHTGALAASKAEWVQRVGAFFASALASRP